MAKVIVDILKPLVGISEHLVHNAHHFIQQIKDITLEPDERLTLYDVTALFTSVTAATAPNVIQNKLEQK